MQSRTERLESHVHGQAAGGEGALAARRHCLRLCDERKRVMVVDDEPDIRELLAVWLRDEGFEVTTAENGLDALGLLADFSPDAIVLDLMMPVMDGWAFAEACSQMTGPVGIPIVVVSATHALTKAADRLRPYGVRACLAKPFDLGVLTTMVNTLVQRPGVFIATAS
jgi:two-component system, chemotaxis family, chemotaxis protein CheY